MKVAFLEPLGVSQEKLRETVDGMLGAAVEASYFDTRSEDPEVLAERAKGADCVVLSNIRFDREIISRLPDLKYINVAFTGVDLIDVEHCRERGIRVSNCAGYSTAAVADLVFGMVIDLARNILPCNEAVRAGGTKNGLVGFELEGKKFGVIGAGAIGTRVLRIAQAFGCETYAYSRTVKEIEGVMFVSLETLLSECDIISLHVPQNASTIGMIGEKEFAMMKPTALFVNCARGPVVDSAALADALNSGRIAGAAVDVVEKEPPIDPDHVLLKARNLIATPHVAFASAQAFEKRAVIVCENLKGWLEGAPVNVIC